MAENQETYVVFGTPYKDDATTLCTQLTARLRITTKKTSDDRGFHYVEVYAQDFNKALAEGKKIIQELNLESMYCTARVGEEKMYPITGDESGRR